MDFFRKLTRRLPTREGNTVKFRRTLWLAILVIGVGSLWITGHAQHHEPDVRFVATPQEVVVEMLKVAKVTPRDIVYDLGCGDGRIVITAAKILGARGVGIDIDPVRIGESNENAVKAGVTYRVKFIQQDLFETDVSEATVVFLYLLEELNLRLRPRLLRELKPGSRVVSHEFDMGAWKPGHMGIVRQVKIYYDPAVPEQKDTYYYYWVIPANAAGRWHWTLSTSAGRRDYTLHLQQEFQEIIGKVNIRGREVPIDDARLVGNHLSFAFKEDINEQKMLMRFDGRINGNTLQGNVEVQGGPFGGKYHWTTTR